MKNHISLSGLILLSACAYRSQVIRLNPAAPEVPPVAAAPTGNQEVFLTTRDARTTQEIGRRAGGSQNVATITTDTDIAALLQTQMTDILKAKGYNVVSATVSNVPTLEVQLKELSYATVTENKATKVKVFVLLETVVKHETKTLRTKFQAQQEHEIVFEPVARTNEEWINEAFALAISEIAKDTKLYSYLD